MGSGWMVRLRGVVVAALVVLGYWAPWSRALGVDGGGGPNAHAWGMLAVTLGKSGAMGIGTAFAVVLGVGIGLAVAGAVLTTVGEAKGLAWMGAAGTVVHVAALALLMPVSGAVFAVATVAVWEVVVGRIVAGQRPMGLMRAALREVYFWAVAACYAAAGWGYNAGLLVRCVVVSAGVGLVVRGVLGER